MAIVRPGQRPFFVLVFVAFLLAAFAGCASFGGKSAVDRLDIKSVDVLPGRTAESVTIQVTVDYGLATKAEGLVVMELDLNQQGNFEPVAENYVDRRSGTIRLMAQCQRSPNGWQKVRVALAEFPRATSLVRLVSKSRKVALP